MLQNEFEALYGKKVSEAEYEIINAMYMRHDDENKKDFVERYKNMTKEAMLDEFVVLNARSNQYTNELLKAKKDAEAREEAANNEIGKTRADLGKVRIELAELQQKHHDFAAMVAVETHQYDKTATIAACIETLGLAGYYKTLLHAGCTPTQEDLKMFVETLENSTTTEA